MDDPLRVPLATAQSLTERGDHDAALVFLREHFPQRPPASEAEALVYLPFLYEYCRCLAMTRAHDRTAHSRRMQARVLLRDVMPSWGAFFVRQTFNRSLNCGEIGKIHLRVFGILASWLGAALHLELPLRQATEYSDFRFLRRLAEAPARSPLFLGDEPCFWLGDGLHGSNAREGTGDLQCTGVTNSAKMPVGAPIERPVSHRPTWVSFEQTKLILDRPQEDAEAFLDPEDRCWFCRAKVDRISSPHWRMGLRETSAFEVLHDTCMIFPTQLCTR